MDFSAGSVECWNRDGVVTVLLGNPERVLALTISGLKGAPGHTVIGHTVEWNDQSNVCANAVKAIRLAGRELRIELVDQAAERLGETEFGIELACGDAALREAVDSLQAIFGNKFESDASSIQSAAAAQADPAGERYLNLEGRNLKALPANVGELVALEVAKLAGNPGLDFRDVCEILGKLPRLRELSFTTDQPVPANLGALQQLERLSLDGFAQPLVLPESLGQLTRLKRLLIMSEADVILPESLGELVELEALTVRAPSWQAPVGLCRLGKLTDLDLGNCRFPRLPEEMAGMTAVTTLYLAGQNFAEMLPIVARMPNLHTLQLAGGPIPAEIALCQQVEGLTIWGAREISGSIGELKRLRKLVLSLCDFGTLPETIGELASLTLLEVSENPSLRELPESLGRLTELRHLFLDENPGLQALPESLGNLHKLEQVRLPEGLAVPEGWDQLLS